MSRASRLLIAGLTTFAFAGTAVAADEPPADGADPAATDPAAADPAAADPAVTDPAAGDPAAAPSARWTRDIISRVLTLPKGLAMVGLDVGTATNAFFDPAGIRVLAGYGITDDLELAFAGYTFPTSDVGKGSIDAQVGFKLVRGAMGGKLEAIARAGTGYSLAAEGLNPISLGVHVQYNITPKLAIITPGGQLQIGVADSNKAKHIVIPVSVGYQITPTLYAQLDTTLAQIKIADSASTFIFADTTPLFIGAYLNAMPALDVYAGLGLNLTPPEVFNPVTMMTTSASVGDTLAVLFGARYYIGQL